MSKTIPTIASHEVHLILKALEQATVKANSIVHELKTVRNCLEVMETSDDASEVASAKAEAVNTLNAPDPHLSITRPVSSMEHFEKAIEELSISLLDIRELNEKLKSL